MNPTCSGASLQRITFQDLTGLITQCLEVVDTVLKKHGTSLGSQGSLTEKTGTAGFAQQ